MVPPGRRARLLAAVFARLTDDAAVVRCAATSRCWRLKSLCGQGCCYSRPFHVSQGNSRQAVIGVVDPRKRIRISGSSSADRLAASLVLVSSPLLRPLASSSAYEPLLHLLQ